MLTRQQDPGALEALKARAADLQAAVARMEAEQAVLKVQVADKSLGVMSMGAQSQLMQLQRDLAGMKAQLQIVNQQIEAIPHVDMPSLPPGFFTQQDPHPRNFLPWMSDDALTAASFIVLFSVLVPLSIGLARRLWRRKPLPAVNPPGHDEVVMRLGRMEQAIDTIAIEIERVAEGQRFVTKVMSERPLQARAVVQSAEANDPALGEAQPFLALGAGPIEPIRVAERQKVKQSITPH